jgi:YidC/Oxa1 family membrane protein insertase
LWHSFVQWFGSLIQFMYGVTESIGFPNYGLAIIFMTVLIKIVLFPLTQKQMKSMRGLQEIQPKMKYIQEKYKDDSQTMQMKLMELYKEHNVNPFGGCLPLLIQMPIFIAFYQSLYRFDFKVAEHARFLWIPDIAQTDPYYILAILAAASTFIQQKISMVNATDPTQRTMLYIMPLFMAWIAATLPAGLPLYWIVFNILGIIQQLYVNWSSKKIKLDTGTGITIETTIEGSAIDPKKQNSGTDEKAIGRDKGGTKKNEKPHSRKKGKKR